MLRLITPASRQLLSLPRSYRLPRHTHLHHRYSSTTNTTMSQWQPGRYPPSRRSDHVDTYKSKAQGSLPDVTRVFIPQRSQAMSSRRSENCGSLRVARGFQVFRDRELGHRCATLHSGCLLPLGLSRLLLPNSQKLRQRSRGSISTNFHTRTGSKLN